MAEMGTTAAEIFERHHLAVFKFFRRVTGRPDVAEDLTQETLLRAHAKMDTLEDPSRLSSWLYRIATNICYVAENAGRVILLHARPDLTCSAGGMSGEGGLNDCAGARTEAPADSAIVFFVYWAVARRRSLRVVCVLLASYYFYALWNPRLVPLLFALSSIDFLTARGISITTNSRLRRVLLITSLVTDVGTLFVFNNTFIAGDGRIQFLSANVFLVRCDEPAVAGRIFHAAAAVAVEHVRRLHDGLPAGLHRLPEHAVHVGNIEIKRGRGCLGPFAFFGNHDAGIADERQRMHD